MVSKDDKNLAIIVYAVRALHKMILVKVCLPCTRFAYIFLSRMEFVGTFRCLDIIASFVF